MRNLSIWVSCFIFLNVLFAYIFLRDSKFVQQLKEKDLNVSSPQRLNRLVHDFGVVRPNQQLEHLFTIQNQSGQSVRPMSVVASCTCLKAAVKNEWYSPNDEIPAKVRMQASRSPIAMRQELVIKFEDKALDDIVLELNALVRNDLHVSKDKLALGEHVGNAVHEPEFTISNFSDENWPSVDVVSDVNWISAVCEPVKNVTPSIGRQAWNCRVNINLIEIRAGTHNANLTIRDSLGINETSIPIELNLRPNISAFPGSWYFFKNELPDKQSRLVFRKDITEYLSRIRVDVSESLNELLIVSLERKGDGGTELIIHGRCKKRPVIETSGEIIVSCDSDPDCSTTIPILIVP